MMSSPPSRFLPAMLSHVLRVRWRPGGAPPSRCSHRDHQLTRGRDNAGVLLEQNRRGAVLLDERGAGDLAAGAERFALVDRAGQRPARVAEIDLALPGRLRALTFGEAGKAQLRALSDHGKPDIDHLDRLVGRVVGVAMLIERVERG